MPSKDLGIFVATNTRNYSFCYKLINEIVRRFYPSDNIQLPQKPVKDVRLYEGTWYAA
ncbi:MAG TPA: hypothetical protein VGQ09_09480 [Chitinophagaceae bacterium]|nr:hypothetical protein [Chitinophagaceae bacterium]